MAVIGAKRQPRAEVFRDSVDLLAKVREAIRAVVPKVPAKKIVPEATLVELEIDSLRIVELTLALERALGQPVFLHDWISRVNHPRELTVGSLAEYLAAVSSES